MQNDATKKTKSAHKLALVMCLIVVATAASIFFVKQKHTEDINSNLSIGSNNLIVEVVKTFQEKQRGLCCRSSLDQNAGMLFVYNKPGNYRFWMKDTRIPLDMYWIDSEKKIVHIEHSAQPSSYPKTFGTEKPAQYILETNAGYAKSKNIQIGDSVRF